MTIPIRATGVSIVVSISSLLLVAGCTAEPVTPAIPPSPSVSSATSPDPSSSSIAPSVQPSGSASFSKNDFTCEPPTPGVMKWISENINNGPSYPPDGVVIVKVGEGNVPGENWWVVTWDMVRDGKSSPYFYLTNEPDPAKPSGETWIDLGSSWSDIHWDDTHIAKLRVARDKAMSCVPAN